MPAASAKDALSSLRELVGRLGNSDARPVTLEQIPRVADGGQRAAYAALAEEVYAGLEGPPEARARSAKGQLASALWQRVTEWDEHAEDEG